ncbi:MAG: hypothetical protein NTV05_03645 [Acidobacteria bacterium]|nr:hypothetical protein [Acidobacteriota bacterium]
MTPRRHARGARERVDVDLHEGRIADRVQAIGDGAAERLGEHPDVRVRAEALDAAERLNDRLAE